VDRDSTLGVEETKTRVKGKSVAEDAAAAASRMALTREVSTLTDMEGSLDLNDTTDLEVIFAGYLMKREGLAFYTWDVRFVWLCRGNPKRKLAGRIFMLFYNNHTRDFSRGRSEIDPASGATSSAFDREYYDEGRRGFVFGIQPKTGARLRLFDCESEEVRTKWIAALNSVGVDHKGLQTTPLVHASSIKEGWVNKCPKRSMGIWNRRFVTLTTTTCIYSRGRADTHAQGMIMITPKTTVAVSDKRPFTFKVVSDPSQPANSHQGREFIFQTADETSFRSWLDAWNSVVKKA